MSSFSSSPCLFSYSQPVCPLFPFRMKRTRVCQKNPLQARLRLTNRWSCSVTQQPIINARPDGNNMLNTILSIIFPTCSVRCRRTVCHLPLDDCQSNLAKVKAAYLKWKEQRMLYYTHGAGEEHVHLTLRLFEVSASQQEIAFSRPFLPSVWVKEGWKWPSVILKTTSFSF